MKKQLLKTILLGAIAAGMAGCSTSTETASKQPSAEPVKVGGSSEVYEIVEQLTEGYRQSTPDAKFEFFPPSQTAGGIQGVKANALDIGILSRKLTAEESAGSLTYVPLVEVPLVMAVHESVTGITNITTEQLKAIYSGQISNWQELGGPDAKIALFDFTEDENEKQVLRETYLGETLEITPEAIVFAEDDELVESAAITQYSVAALPFEEELSELPITILTINDIAPSLENVKSGDYAMTLALGIVFSQDASSELDGFIDFVNGDEGQQIIEGFLESSEDD